MKDLTVYGTPTLKCVIHYWLLFCMFQWNSNSDYVTPAPAKQGHNLLEPTPNTALYVIHIHILTMVIVTYDASPLRAGGTSSLKW